MKGIATVAFIVAQAAVGATALADGGAVSLRLGGKEIALPAGVGVRLAGLARETFSRCGPNTRQHPHNFGASAILAADRLHRTLDGSRLHVAYGAPFESVSELGGALMVSEVTLGLEGGDLFVGPIFTRDGRGTVEHLQCQYLPALEIACLSELAPHLPARYRETCARLTRAGDGRLVMPPPDIAPSCS